MAGRNLPDDGGVSLVCVCTRSLMQEIVYAVSGITKVDKYNTCLALAIVMAIIVCDRV